MDDFLSTNRVRGGKLFHLLWSYFVTAGQEAALVASLVRRVAGGDAPKEEEL